MRPQCWGCRDEDSQHRHLGRGASSLKGLENLPDVEVYFVDDPDKDNQVDMALLNDLITPCKLAFVGGDLAKRLATAYSETWVEDTPSVNEDLLAFWNTP
jgi:hypothetical protein